MDDTPETTLRQRATGLLRALTGQADAEFHDGQFEAIEALVAGHRRALVVQRTGWGKSAVYVIAALVQRHAGHGPALIVSPLLALMRNQVAAAERAGVRAATINSSNVTDWRQIADEVADDAVDVLLISPERLVNPRFREEMLPGLIARAGLVVIDEAHCISDWGHDFRPDYRRIRALIAELPADVPVLATTATANQRVVTDVAEQLAVGGHEVFTLRGELARKSLRLGVLRLDGAAERLAWLSEHLAELPGSGIIYCLTVASAEDTATALRAAGYNVVAYTGRSDLAERVAAEQALLDNRVKALVATSALGMGFDKPDLGFVVHLGAPGSPVAYYQQVGRAGRASASADVLLLPGREDPEIWHFFATHAMPTRARAAAVIEALQADGPLSLPALEGRVDIRRGPLELLLKVLAVDGVVVNQQGGWAATGRPWAYDERRYERIAAARVAEQDAMLAYEALPPGSCRMEYLTAALDDPNAAPCGRCDNCAGSWYPTTVTPAAQLSARSALDRVGVPLEPRVLWPTGAPAKGRIPAEEQVAEGRTVARLTDLGYGNTLREIFAPDADGNPVDQEVPAELTQACLRVLREWPWQQRPAGVVWVPSRTRPKLVASLGQGLARAGRLRDLGPLALAPDAGPLRPANSTFRVRDLWHRFAVTPEQAAQLPGLGGPVLLVDDRVDSRWTITVAGRLLRLAGAPAVLPFALAATA